MAKKGKAPSKYYRDGITLIQLMDMFPDEPTAEAWFEDRQWGNDRERQHCPYCGGTNRIQARKNRKPMPYHCGDCRKYFSVRTGTAMAESRLPLRKWALAIYICTTSLKSVSSLKLHRDLGITQKSAWFMLQRLREAWKGSAPKFEGPVEADETYMGGLEKNKHSKKKHRAGRGAVGKTAVGKTAVAGVRDRKTNKIVAKVVEKTDGKTLKGFVRENTTEDAQVYTDEAKAYKGMDRPHESVAHTVGEFVRDQAHTSGLESFWATLKRAHDGTFHHISKKHLQRYVGEFAGRHNARDHDTLDMMEHMVAGMTGRRLTFKELTA